MRFETLVIHAGERSDKTYGALAVPIYQTSTFAFATGMAAETTVMHLLKAGDHVISGDDIYGGTYRLFQNVIASMPKDVRDKVGITDGVVRLSVGIENVDDLIEDLENALEPSERRGKKLVEEANG